MSFEDNNQKLGNYYLHKGAEVHRLIDEIEKGKQVTPAETNKLRQPAARTFARLQDLTWLQ